MTERNQPPIQVRSDVGAGLKPARIEADNMDKNRAGLKPAPTKDLPEGWAWKTLGEVVRPTRPRIKPGDKPSLQFIGMEHVEAHTMNLLGTIPADSMKSSAVHFQAGDILYGRLRPYLNKVYRPAFEGLCSAEFIVFPETDSINSKYLQYFLNSSTFVSFASHLNTGDRPRVDFEQLAPYPFPFAPLAQQKLIVSEIEKQFSRLDEAVAGLKRIKANLKRYKAAVLKAAGEGKLTEEWRLSARKRAQVDELESVPKAITGKWFVYIIECDNETFYVGQTSDLHSRWKAHCEGKAADWTRQYPPKYLIHFEELGSQTEAVKRERDLKTGYGRTWRKREIAAGRMNPIVHNSENETGLPVHGVQTGADLLKRILAERKKKWEEKNPGKKYKEPVAPDTSTLPELPKGWACVTWEMILAPEEGAFGRGPFGSALKKSIFVDSGYKVYEQYCPINDDPSFARYYINPEKYGEMAQFSVKARDFLISCSGVTLGRITQIPDTFEPGIINQALLRVRLHHRIVDDAYFIKLFRSPYFQRRIFDNSQGAAIPNVKGVKELKAIPLPLPPLDEQKIIVQVVEEQVSIILEVERQVDANLKRAERLRQSILKKAFAGQLSVNCYE